MITLYSGTPGSGKSYHMSRDIAINCRLGRTCLANFVLSPKKGSCNFRFVDNSELSPAFLSDFSREYFVDRPFKEGAIKLYIDECQVLFAARNWNDSLRADWIFFFTQHRKLGYDIYLITQFDKMIDKQIRALIEYEVQHRKVNNIGTIGFIASVLALGHPVFVANRYYYGMRYRLDSSWLIGRKSVYALYSTTNTFKADKG